MQKLKTKQNQEFKDNVKIELNNLSTYVTATLYRAQCYKMKGTKAMKISLYFLRSKIDTLNVFIVF